MASSTPQTALLSPIDQYMPRIYTTIFLIFETLDRTSAVDKLRAGLTRLNQRLPYLKGRVFATDGGRAAIRWSPTDKDIELQEMPTDGVPLLRLSVEKLKAERAPLHYFTDTLGPMPRLADLDKDSGASVLATNYGLLDGGIVLCLAVEHNVMDGAGMVELIRFWAACTRSETIDPATTPTPDPNEPLYRHERLRQATEPITQDEHQSTPAQQSFDDLLARHPEFRLASTKAAPAAPLPSPLGTSKIFTFSTAKLEATKTTLQTLHPGSAARPATTTNSVLCATLWSCITRVRRQRRGREPPTTTSPTSPAAAADGVEARSRLGFAINGRARLGAAGPLADPRRPFLGNVALHGLARVDVAELERATATAAAAGDGADGADGDATDGADGDATASGMAALGRVVQAIGEAVGRVTPGFAREVMDLIEQTPVDGGGLAFGWNSLHGMDVMVTSWANMDLYGVDFGEGVGRPCLVRVTQRETDGFVIVLPRQRGEEEEGIDVMVAMHVEDMAALEGDAVWTSYLV
ncbi:uncharacterized protein B0H64DRAFT_473474 [Chaetomium fimeti]|uniref:Trichothecene 3-O-acetyltransferase-like N-terminal domain-containing protein n=1 Tax=Chaetomium fimeti TaxID=1854472 RepID=A0AAE0LTM7_9PEZI|nr:hypothetical protein B0H64DRAFT_473474 [Chaetomium fimeti]